MERLPFIRGRNFTCIGVLFLFLRPASVAAYCEEIRQDLKKFTSQKETYSRQNEERLQKIQDREITCNTEGDVLSKKLAALAASLSCTAQIDAAGLNQQVRNLGTTCEGDFRDMKDLQTAMRSEFEKIQQEVDSETSEIAGSENLRIVCDKELQQFTKMSSDYKEVDEKIVNVQEHAHKSENTYMKFAGTAENLRLLTAAGGTNCQDQPNSGPAGGANDPRKTAGFSGTSENPASDITGIREDKAKRNQFKVSDAVLPAKKVDAFTAPKEKTETARNGNDPSSITVSVPAIEPATADSTINREADPSGTFSARGAIGLSAEATASINKSEALRKKFGAVDSSVGSVLWEAGKDSSSMTLQAAPAANAPLPAQPSSAAEVAVNATAGGKPGGTSGAANGLDGDITPLPVIPESAGRHLASALSLLPEANAASAAAETNETLFERVHHRYRASEQFQHSASAARFFR